MLDLCTGSGCIPLLLCHLWPPGSLHAVGVDASTQALDLATENAERCGIGKIDAGISGNAERAPMSPPLANTLAVMLGDVFEDGLITRLAKVNQAGFDLIVSNPPYIPKKEYGD